MNYLQWDLHYAAISEERRDGTVQLTFNAATGACVPMLKPLALAQGLELRPSKIDTDNPLKVNTALMPKVHDLARERIQAELHDFLTSLRRRMGGDLERLEQYYKALLDGLTRRRTKADTRKAKKEAINLERESKKRDLAAKYAVSVEVDLVCLRHMLLPVATARWVLQRRRTEREVILVWNPLMHDMESLACQACARDTCKVTLCEAGHLLCAECGQACPICRNGKTGKP